MPGSRCELAWRRRVRTISLRLDGSFTRAVHLAPQVAATHAALGSILLAQGEIAAASSELERAHSLSPDDQGVTINLARAESLAGRYSEALPLFREALGSSPQPVLSDDELIAFTTALSATGDAAEAETRLASAAQTPLVVDALGAGVLRGDREVGTGADQLLAGDRSGPCDARGEVSPGGGSDCVGPA